MDTGWYKVLNALNASKGAIDGIRTQKAVVGKGEIIPKEWFGQIHPQEFPMFINFPPDGLGAIEPYEPDDQEYPFLYSLFPGAIPTGASFEIQENGFHTKRWFRILSIRVRGGLISRSFNGLAALCTVDGVCNAFDVAEPDTVIPVAWLSGLNTQNVNRLLADQYIQSYKPSPYELDTLYAKYPATNPDYKVSLKKTSKKTKPKNKKTKEDVIKENTNANVDPGN